MTEIPPTDDIDQILNGTETIRLICRSCGYHPDDGWLSRDDRCHYCEREASYADD